MSSRSSCLSDRVISEDRRDLFLGSAVEVLRFNERSIQTSHGRVELCTTSGKGVPLVLLHGRSSCKSEFGDLMASSLGVERSLVAVDLPGHGDSSDADDPDHTYTLEGYTDAVVEVLEHLGIECAAFLGRSLGSHVGLQMAYSFPGFVGLLVNDGWSNVAVPVLEVRPATVAFAPQRRRSHITVHGEELDVVPKPSDDRDSRSPYIVARADDRYFRLREIDLPPKRAELLAASRAIGRRRPFMRAFSACCPFESSRRALDSCGLRSDSGELSAKHLAGHHGSSLGLIRRFLRQADRVSNDIPNLGLCLSG